MKNLKKILIGITLMVAISAQAAYAKDCTVSIASVTATETLGNSSFPSIKAAEELTAQLVAKGYTIDSNSVNEAFVAFGCVLTDGEPVIKLSIISAGIKVKGQESASVDAEGSGLTYSAAERRAFRRVMKKFSKEIPNCQ